jgi:hypothetical protein
LLVLDSLGFEDVPMLSERLLRGERGILAALRSETAAGLARLADLVVHLERGPDGLPRAVSLDDANGQPVFAHDAGSHDTGGLRCRNPAPSFAELLRARGHGAALARILR